MVTWSSSVCPSSFNASSFYPSTTWVLVGILRPGVLPAVTPGPFFLETHGEGEGEGAWVSEEGEGEEATWNTSEHSLAGKVVCISREWKEFSGFMVALPAA